VSFYDYSTYALQALAKLSVRITEAIGGQEGERWLEKVDDYCLGAAMAASVMDQFCWLQVDLKYRSRRKSRSYFAEESLQAIPHDVPSKWHHTLLDTVEVSICIFVMAR